MGAFWHSETVPLEPQPEALRIDTGMILLVGPTGETARRVIRYAEAAGVALRLGARDVQSARARLGPLGAGFEIRQVDAADQASAERALERGDVLLNAATPAGAHGHILARAAISAGAHYTAFTGEVIDTLRLLHELDEPARNRGVVLCPGAGSSGTMGDLVTRLALRSLPDATDGLTAAAITGFVASHGTLLSEMNILNGPGVVISGGDLVEEDNIGTIIRRNGLCFIERPLIDSMMVWTLGHFTNFRAAIEVPEAAAATVSEMFIANAAQLRSEAGRAAYLATIASMGHEIGESEASEEGTRRAIVWNGTRSATAVITSRPVYEVTARAALMVSRALDKRTDQPSGFQAPSKLVRSLDHALSELGSRIVLQ